MLRRPVFDVVRTRVGMLSMAVCIAIWITQRFSYWVGVARAPNVFDRVLMKDQRVLRRSWRTRLSLVQEMESQRTSYHAGQHSMQ